MDIMNHPGPSLRLIGSWANIFLWPPIRSFALTSLSLPNVPVSAVEPHSSCLALTSSGGISGPYATLVVSSLRAHGAAALSPPAGFGSSATATFSPIKD